MAEPRPVYVPKTGIRGFGIKVGYVPKVFPYTWVAEKALPQLTEHRASFKKVSADPTWHA